MKPVKPHQRNKKPCKGCGRLFIPTSKYSKFCDDCLDKKNQERIRKLNESIKLKKKYNVKFIEEIKLSERRRKQNKE